MASTGAITVRTVAGWLIRVLIRTATTATVACICVHAQSGSETRALDIVRNASEAVHTGSVTTHPRTVHLLGHHITSTAPSPGLSLEITFRDLTSFEWKEQRVRGGYTEYFVTADETRMRQTGDTEKTLTPTGHQSLRKRWTEFALVFLAALPSRCLPTFDYLGERDLNGTGAVGISVGGPCSAVFRAWFNVQSFRLVTLESEVVVVIATGPPPLPQQEGARVVAPSLASQIRRVTAIPSDFRNANGLLLPFMVSIVRDQSVETLLLSRAEVVW